MRVAIATDSWPPYPVDTSIYSVTRDTLEALRRNGVDAVPYPINTHRGARVGGLVRPYLRRTFTRYKVPPGTIVHQVCHNGLRGCDVVTIQDFYMFYGNARLSDYFFRDSIRVSIRRAKRVVLTTHWSVEEAAKFFPADREKFRVVAVAIPTARPGMGPITYDALWVGRNTPNKDLPLFLQLAARFPDLKFALRYSKSPGRKNLDAYVEQLLRVSPARNNVRLIPRLSEEELDLLFRASEILVVTSNYEGFHIPAMEAYLRGGKIVVPRIPPFPEIYGDRDVFWYDLQGGLEALAAAFRAAKEAPFRSPSPAVADAVSLETVGRKLKAVYEELVGRPTATHS